MQCDETIYVLNGLEWISLKTVTVSMESIFFKYLENCRTENLNCFIAVKLASMTCGLSPLIEDYFSQIEKEVLK